MRSTYQVITAFVAFNLTVATCMAQQFPMKPIRVVTDGVTGGLVDVVARSVSQRASEELRQTLVVDNRPGAEGAVAREVVTRSPSDGYTVFVSNRAFDSKELVRVATIGSLPLVVVTPAGTPWKNMNELVAAAKAKPNQLSYGSSGVGSSEHIAMEVFAHAAGISLQHVPYKGGSPALMSLLTGESQLMLASPAASLPHVRNGKLRALAVASTSRMRAAPQVPTINEEIRIPFSYVQPYAVYVRTDTPKSIRTKLGVDFARAAEGPAVREQLVMAGLNVAPRAEGDTGNTTCASDEKYCPCLKQCIKKDATCPTKCTKALDRPE